MEMIFDAKRCLVKNMLAYSKYPLTRETIHWWASMKIMLEDNRENITWELFKNVLC